MFRQELNEGIASQRSLAVGELRALRAAHDAAVQQCNELEAERCAPSVWLVRPFVLTVWHDSAHLLEAIDVTNGQLAQVWRWRRVVTDVWSDKAAAAGVSRAGFIEAAGRGGGAAGSRPTARTRRGITFARGCFRVGCVVFLC
jgi:hypothetical protein